MRRSESSMSSMTDMSDADNGDRLYHVRKSRLIRLINWWQVGGVDAGHTGCGIFEESRRATFAAVAVVWRLVRLHNEYCSLCHTTATSSGQLSFRPVLASVASIQSLLLVFCSGNDAARVFVCVLTVTDAAYICAKQNGAAVSRYQARESFGSAIDSSCRAAVTTVDSNAAVCQISIAAL